MPATGKSQSGSGRSIGLRALSSAADRTIQPKVIVALGKVAAANLLATDAPIGSLRGKRHDYRGIPRVATYHPAYLLRSLPDKAKAWADLCLARRTILGMSS